MTPATNANQDSSPIQIKLHASPALITVSVALTPPPATTVNKTSPSMKPEKLVSPVMLKTVPDVKNRVSAKNANPPSFPALTKTPA